MADKGQQKDTSSQRGLKNIGNSADFVLSKSIFSNVFDKDIRRVYLYKRSERLAKALHLVSPAFADAPALSARLEGIALALLDAAALPPASARGALARELLSLSSVLSIGRTSGRLSPMNAEFILREADALLSDAAAYEDPRLSLEELPSLAGLARAATVEEVENPSLKSVARVTYEPVLGNETFSKGHLSDNGVKPTSAPRANGRREAILEALRAKSPAYIRDISSIVRDVSEKTIQRELSVLVTEGLVLRKGDRRWTTYELAQ